MQGPACLTRDLTEPEPIPEAGIVRAVELMRSGRLFRYGEMGADQLDVSLLEQEFAAFVGRKYCVAVNSGGGALFLALKVVGVQPGDPVLVNGFTLAPVPGAILHAAARPVIVEINKDYVIDPDDLRAKAIATGARVLMLSHMRGHLADMDAVIAICSELGLTLIEDCAHAMCASWKGRAIGTFGAAAAFSAQTYKHLNAGEGGFLVLDDNAMTARAIMHSGSYMLHGQHLSSPGRDALAAVSGETPNFSMRMTALAAAMLRPQLAELPRRVSRWNTIHDRIAAGLARSQLVHVPERGGGQVFSATSVQFSVLGLSDTEMQAFLNLAKDRGVPVKWFGASQQVGFTSAPRHWRYAGDQGSLDATHKVLATLCDIRTPISLSEDECDLIAQIVRESIETVVSASAETGATGQGAPVRRSSPQPRERTMKRLLAGFLLATALVGAQPSTVQAQTPIGVSYQPSLYWALPFHYANVKGWWKDVGLTPNFTTFPAGAPQIAAAPSKSWDVGGTGSVPAVLGAVRFNILTIGITNDESKTNAMMVRGDKFDAIKANPASLKGQRLLLTTNSTVDYASRKCLVKMGLAANDMQFVNLGQAQIITALTSNNGDIAGVWAPNTYTLEEKAGAKYLCSGGDADATVPGALIVRGDFAKEKPEDVAKFLAVFLRGWSWANANPAEARTLALDFYKQGGLEVSARAMDQEFALRPTFGLDAQLKIMARAAAGSTVDGWFSEIGKFVTDVGTIPANPDPKSYISDEFLKRVAADAKLRAFATEFDKK